MRRPLYLLLAAALAVTACSDSSDDPVATPAGDAQSETSTAVAEGTTTGLQASIGREPEHALVGRLVIETDEPSTPTIEVTGEERSFTIPVDEATHLHQVAVAGLRESSTYEIAVTVEGDDGPERVDLELQTGDIPDDIPRPQLVVSEPAAMSPGFTLFNMLDLTDELADVEPEEAPRSGFLVVVDDEGEIVWYHRTDHPIGDVRQLPDGRILHEYNDTGARIIDLFGTTQQEWGGRIITGPLALDSFGRQVVGDDATVVDTDAMHHEVGMLPDGNLVALSTELRTVDGFAEDVCLEGEGFDGSYDLISDIVVEFDPDGEVVAEYPLADFLDPASDPRDANVCGLALGQVFPNWMYWAQGFADARDWTHANAVVPSPDGSAFTVSVRHLSAILQIDRATGELLWRFGPGGDFAITDDKALSFYQHAPEWQDDGTLMVYDNGNVRPGTMGPNNPDGVPPFTRAVRYRLDPEAGTAEVVWEMVQTIDGEPLFAPFVGDADTLANGNVLIANGGLGDGRDDGVTAQLVEVDPSDDTVVYELRIAEPDHAIAIYRAERLESLYPVV